MSRLDPRRCGRRPDAKDRDLRDLGLDLEEEIALNIARLFFQSFAAPESSAWMAALAEAEARFGPRDGPILAARILAALQAVRKSRRSTFLFNSPACPGCAAVATEHERRLMRALSALRRGDRGTARLEAMMLCEGNRLDAVLGALAALGAVLDGRLPDNVSPSRHAWVAE
ncbi:MAG: hypothetical protein ACOCYW_04470 [Roseicyclus sp.]